MARGVGADERRDAVTILADGSLPPPDDVDDAFDQWRDATRESQVPGKVTAWQIPMDDHGVPQPSAKNQIRLGAWPVDAYDFDGLCALLIRDFMPPEKILCVRLLGTKANTAGLQFNRVLTLRAPNVAPEKATNGAAPESTATLMRTIQDNNEKMLQQFRSMLPPPAQRDPMEEITRMMTLARMMNEPMTAMLGQLLPAIAGRPVAPAAADPFGQLSSLVDVFDKLQGLRGEAGGGAGDDGMVGILKALAPLAKPALEAIPSIMSARGPAAVAPQRALPGPPRPATAPPVAAGPMPAAGPAPGSVPTQPTVVPTPAPTTNIGDISSEDQQMFAQLKPQIDSLVAMAAQGSDADGAADLLFDQVIMELPDQFYEKLADLIGGPNFVTQAAVFNPAVNAHAEWFRKFQARIIERYNAEDVAAQSAPTPPVPTAT